MGVHAVNEVVSLTLSAAKKKCLPVWKRSWRLAAVATDLSAVQNIVRKRRLAANSIGKHGSRGHAMT